MGIKRKKLMFFEFHITKSPHILAAYKKFRDVLNTHLKMKSRRLTEKRFHTQVTILSRYGKKLNIELEADLAQHPPFEMLIKGSFIMALRQPTDSLNISWKRVNIQPQLSYLKIPLFRHAFTHQTIGQDCLTPTIEAKITTYISSLKILVLLLMRTSHNSQLKFYQLLYKTVDLYNKPDVGNWHDPREIKNSPCYCSLLKSEGNRIRQLQGNVSSANFSWLIKKRYTQLFSYFSANNVISDHKYGFQLEKSTKTTLLSIKECLNLQHFDKTLYYSFIS